MTQALLGGGLTGSHASPGRPRFFHDLEVIFAGLQTLRRVVLTAARRLGGLGGAIALLAFPAAGQPHPTPFRRAKS